MNRHKHTFLGLLIMCFVGNCLALASISQRSYINQKFGMFLHFGINTIYDQELGNGTEDPVRFNPAALDASQWVNAAVQAKMNYMVLVAKHHDGFCLWNSTYTNFDVGSSPWKAGQGDVVQEFVTAARQRGLNAGLYYSIWDRHEPSYENNWAAYTDYVKNQLTELLTKYGPIKVIWFDVWDFNRVPYSAIYNHIKSLQPNCLVLAGGTTDLSQTEIASYWQRDQVPEDSNPKEFHQTIRSDGQWFYHPAGNEQLLSVEGIIQGIYSLVGNSGTTLLNVTPDTTGVIPANQVELLRIVGENLQFPRRTIYVDSVASGTYDGSSWTNAIVNLQNAIQIASQGDEIRVAQGTYRPDRGYGLVTGNRSASFQLKEGMVIRGGYAGSKASNPDEWNPTQYPTVLSGDLTDNDVQVAKTADLLTHASRNENSYHVVTGTDLSEKTVLDGVQISGGNSNGNGSDAWGGGISLTRSNPVIQNCTIRGNTGKEGNGITCDAQSSPMIEKCVISGNAALWIAGGIDCWWSSNPTIIECIIQDNWTNGDGAGMYTGDNSCPMIQNTVFQQNTALGNGGGIFNLTTNSELNGCSFIDNHASWGGGMYNKTNANASVSDCIFENNSASSTNGVGGGVLNDLSSGTFRNCTFRMNSATWGGGMSNPHGGGPTITECLFEGNTSTNSAGMENWQGATTVIQNCVFKNNVASNWAGGVSCGVDTTSLRSTPRIENCLFYGNRADNSNSGAIGVNVNGDPIIKNCTLYGNISKNNGAVTCHASAKPMIVNSILWANSRNGVIDESTQIYGSGNLSGRINYSCIQGWTGAISGMENMNLSPQFYNPGGGEFHIKSQAGRYDPSVQAWVKDNITSPCIDAGDPTDEGWKNELWPHGGRINMGVYGGTPQASMSLNSNIGNPADFDHDGMVGFSDFAILSEDWLVDNCLVPANLDRMGSVDLTDLLIFTGLWMSQ